MNNINEYAELANYLKTGVMAIDIWDGDNDKAQYGTCRVPLSYLLR